MGFFSWETRKHVLNDRHEMTVLDFKATSFTLFSQAEKWLQRSLKFTFCLIWWSVFTQWRSLWAQEYVTPLTCYPTASTTTKKGKHLALWSFLVMRWSMSDCAKRVLLYAVPIHPQMWSVCMFGFLSFLRNKIRATWSFSNASSNEVVVRSIAIGILPFFLLDNSTWELQFNFFITRM